MASQPAFHTHTALARGLRELFVQLEQRLALQQPLVRLGLTTAPAIERRATSALAGYVGNPNMLLLNLRDALRLARSAQVPNQSKSHP
jgi:hypothetical protein